MLKLQLKQWRVHSAICNPGEPGPCLPAGAAHPDTWSLELLLDTSSLHSLFLWKQRGALGKAELLIEQQLLSPTGWWKSSCTSKTLPDPWDGAEKGKGSPENSSGGVKVSPFQGKSEVQTAFFGEEEQPQNLQSPTVHTQGANEKGQHLSVYSLLCPCWIQIWEKQNTEWGAFSSSHCCCNAGIPNQHFFLHTLDPAALQMILGFSKRREREKV